MFIVVKSAETVNAVKVSIFLHKARKRPQISDAMKRQKFKGFGHAFLGESCRFVSDDDKFFTAPGLQSPW